jgi:hypothetical protein
MNQYKNKITGEEVFVRKIPRNLTHPKVFYEIRIADKVEYISLTDFKKIYKKLKVKEITTNNNK